MSYHPVEVHYHTDPHGRRVPEAFVWQGQRYDVLSTGRSWQDERGEHVLVQSAGGVYELMFDRQVLTWWLKPPVGPQMV